MRVNRSGYYKWKVRKGSINRYEHDRIILTELLEEQHNRFKSYGYHRLANVIRNNTGWIFSDNLAHKCCKEANICSKARKSKRRKASGEEHIYYPNHIKGNWNAKKPMEIIVSDMTHIKHKSHSYELTFMLDTFNNEIITHHISSKLGDRTPYYRCLEDLKTKIKEQTAPVVLHTDQGTVYSSRAFRKAHENYNIIRSMSRAATPTDNPIIESINGWIKEEMKLDFDFDEAENFESFINEYMYYYNNDRPAYALNYKTPIQYKIEQGFL